MITGQDFPDEAAMIWSGDCASTGALACPDRIAILTDESNEAISYFELNRRIGRTIYLLRQKGIKFGDRVAYIGRNDAFCIILMIAAMRLGFMLVPINWRCTTREVAYFLSDSSPLIVFSDPDFMQTTKKAIVNLTNPPEIQTTKLGEAKPSDLVHEITQDGPTIDTAIAHGDTNFLLLYTSGTSGTPKGVLSTHRAFSICRYQELIMPGFPQWTGGTIVSGMPLFHIAGMTFAIMALMRQSTCVLTATPSAANLTHLIRMHGATYTFAVPTVIRDIVDEVRQTKLPVPTLKMFLYGAMPIGEKLLRDAIEVLGCEFGQYYGMTEIVGSATFLAPEYHNIARPELMNSVGKPFAGVSIDIRDPGGNSVPNGTIGEIYLRTPSLTPGYWNNPEATNAVICPDGWYRSGDGGRIDAEGFLYLADRIKDMIVSGGENIYPAEVEHILLNHAAIKAAAIIGKPDARWGEMVVAIIELHEGHEIKDEDIISFAKSQIAAYKCPKLIHYVKALPRTASGKIQRSIAKADYLAIIDKN